MLAVLMLTIGSCAGYFATPLKSQKWFPYLMLFMISLAVAVLTGDAMLHLFPHVSLGSQSTKVIFNLYTGGKGKHSLNLLNY